MEAVIVEVVGDDEFTDGVFGFGATESGSEPKADLLVDPFEEVLFRGFGHQFVNVPKRVLFRADAVVGWNDNP